MFAFRVAAACGLGLEIVSECWHQSGFLPLAGGYLAQLGLVFGGTFILVEVLDAARTALQKVLKRHRSRKEGKGSHAAATPAQARRRSSV